MGLHKNSLTEDAYLLATFRIDDDHSDLSVENGLLTYASTMPAQLKNYINVLSHGINPIDRTTLERVHDVDELRRAVMLGACAGALIAEYAYQPYEMTASAIVNAPVEIPLEDIEDPVEKHRIIGGVFIELGARGLELAGEEVGAWLEAREDTLVTDARLRHMFRTSAGIIFFMAETRYARHLEHEDNKRMRDVETAVASAHDIDWDEQFIEQFGAD